MLVPMQDDVWHRAVAHRDRLRRHPHAQAAFGEAPARTLDDDVDHRRVIARPAVHRPGHRDAVADRRVEQEPQLLLQHLATGTRQPPRREPQDEALHQQRVRRVRAGGAVLHAPEQGLGELKSALAEHALLARAQPDTHVGSRNSDEAVSDELG